MSKIYSIGDEEELVADMPNIINERIKAELEEIKSEMQDYGCSFIIAKRSDLASAVSNCIRMVDKHIKEIEEK